MKQVEKDSVGHIFLYLITDITFEDIKVRETYTIVTKNLDRLTFSTKISANVLQLDV